MKLWSRAFASLLGIAILLIAPPPSAQAEAAKDLPRETLFQLYLTSIHLWDEQAKKLESQGKHKYAVALRAKVTSEAKLTQREAEVVHQHAATLHETMQAKDKEIAERLRAARQRAPVNSRGRAVIPSYEVNRLQEERDSLERSKTQEFEAALGLVGMTKLESYLRTDWSKDLKPIGITPVPGKTKQVQIPFPGGGVQ